MSNDEDHSALRAELDARKEEIAVLRGVVAALRDRAATRRRNNEGRERRAGSVIVASVAVVVGALLGFAVALALFEGGRF
jgi:hypothetical protein